MSDDRFRTYILQCAEWSHYLLIDTWLVSMCCRVSGHEWEIPVTVCSTLSENVSLAAVCAAVGHHWVPGGCTAAGSDEAELAAAASALSELEGTRNY
eukprot:SAG31_NODE_6640_length_1942_cov_2.024959_1_plen_97_part_00